MKDDMVAGARKPQTIVIVGGSVAGLIHGLQLKREGHNVTILEKDPRSLRSSHNAGVGFRAGMKEFVQKYDDTGSAITIAVNRIHFDLNIYPGLFGKSVERPFKFEGTSWGLLYRMLRANFDGFASTPYPKPPPPRSTDGKATYATGKNVTDLALKGEKVVVYYTDAATGQAETIAADLVIGADGIRSTVRSIVQAPAVSEYSGYVAWRGTVRESELTKSAIDFFVNAFSYDLMKRTYILCYVVPTDEGNMSPGERLVNWVWYRNVAEGSPEMQEIFTDRHGTLHGNTVSQDLISAAAWDRTRESGMVKMSAPFAELLRKTEQPFVTKVNDVPCSGARYMDGRVLLVGDALSTFRSNNAMSTEQAANHARWLNQALQGEMSMDDWERQVCQFARRIYLVARLIGEGGLGTWMSFAKVLGRYLSLMIGLKIRGSRT